jgi:RNA polymerase sigma-70 factor (ECF subfamily)
MALSAPDIDDDRLVDELGGRLYRLARRLTGANEDAEAAIDEALSAAAAGGAPLASLWRFVARAAHARRRGTRAAARGDAPVALDDVMPPLDGDGLHFEPMPDWSGGVGESAGQVALHAVLTETIDALPADYRTALLLHDTEGLGTADIADVLGIDAPAARSYVHRARLFVRKRLSAHFASTDAA